MSTDLAEADEELLSTFESSLEGLAESVVRTTAAEFAETLGELVEEPAVGAPLPFEGVSYDGTPVRPLSDVEPLRTAKTGVTAVGLGVATYGTVTIRSTADADELVSLYQEHHVAVVAASDIVPDMESAFERLGEEFAAGDSTQILNTGPSATGDMGTLVRGVHGPKRIHVVVLEDR